jgi:LemA protein
MTPPARLSCGVSVAAAILFLAACRSSDGRVAADLAADDRWTAVQAALEVRRGLSRELGSQARARAPSEGVTLALQDLDDARLRTSGMPMSRDDLADPSKASAWQKAQSTLAHARRALARAAEATELEGQLDVADREFAAAVARYTAAATAYDDLLRTAGLDANPLTGRRFLPRVAFATPAGD